MPNQYFKFKQFTVNQDRCAMKVGTDGVVLGVLADFEGCGNIADIGTGTGVVSLIIKQRFPDARITAIEIDGEAAAQAKENFDASPWQIETVNDSWQNYAATGVRFDGIFCNPPYFTNSLKTPSASRTMARHNDSLPFSELLAGVNLALTESGRFYVILPSDCKDDFAAMAREHGLHLAAITYIHPVIEGPHKRVVMRFEKSSPTAPEESHLHLETTERKVYTPEFKELTKDFYL